MTKFDLLTACRLGTLYNSVNSNPMQSEVEEWAKETYPKIWEELMIIGRRLTRLHRKEFKIDRKVEP